MTQFSEHSGYLGRIGNAIKGVVIGGVLFLLSFVVLFWNEGRAVHRAQLLTEGAGAVVDVAPDKIDPGFNGKWVHFIADAKGQTLADPDYGVSVDGIALGRTVTMYQWKETITEKKDAIGGGSTRTATYSKDWYDRYVDSSNFMDRSGGHQNLPMPVDSYIHRASPVTAGVFTLSSTLVNQINNFTPLTPTNIPDRFQNRAALLGGTVYIAAAGATSRPTGDAAAQIGDVKIAFEVAKPGTVSVIACQTDSNLGPFATSSGGTLDELLRIGSVPAKVMFQQEQQSNVMVTWILRGVGLLVMWIGMLLVLSPLKVLADVIGILGDIFGAGLALIAAMASLVLSLMTIAVAWLVYRPVLGVGLLIVAAAVAYGMHTLRTKAKARRVQSAPPPVMQ